MNFKVLLAVSIAIALQGCGVESGDKSSAPAPPISVQETSYKNFKEAGLTPQIFPDERSSDAPIRAFADFAQSGTLDMFIVEFDSPWPPTTVDELKPAIMEFWQKKNNGKYELRNDLFINSNDGCANPRKALVADYNKDQLPDVFIACHGFDDWPFPGEKNKIVLSQPDGRFLIQDAYDHTGYSHGASAADINGDSYPDVIVTDNSINLSNSTPQDSVYILLNNGDGTFKKDEDIRLPDSVVRTGFFTVDLVDVDGDGYVDVLLGGHEDENDKTLLLINDGSGFFNKTDPVVIPGVSGDTEVLDFAVTNENQQKIIWINRTNENYESRVIQKVLWPSLTSSVPLDQNPERWLMWILPTIVNGENVIATEHESFGVLLNY
ncbi:FG-GAP repeat domain-containing protein [Oceanospirillum sanctuarii]|uniref:FG-GAP repeat domain-containing protein n=1 Tax=Oceanospirillum sanctuarii TaxID=1434821 RepID=UPI000A388915|nr:VCBS repeat-containing protein [Oceanospirillum sanctuarii]